ncbi:alpha-E domain-containing protein [Altererythrobacter sp. CAU 1778]
MLGRTAGSIFWMYRYLERAENSARLLEAGFRMALTRSAEEASTEWRSVVQTLGVKAGYEAAGGDYSGVEVCNYVLRDKENPLNVMELVNTARQNARESRAAITAEVWEAVNESWMQLRDLLNRPVRESSIGTALAQIRRSSSLARGATYGSMLRNEIYCFARAGTFVERADNTARILDVKYYLLLPSLSFVGSSLDSGQWDTVLRSLSAERAYRWLNAGRMDPRSIAEFLILDARFPRSLAFCYSQLQENLAALAREHGGESYSHEVMREIATRFSQGSIEEVFDIGLHQFLLNFIDDNQSLSQAISTDFRFVS